MMPLTVDFEVSIVSIGRNFTDIGQCAMVFLSNVNTLSTGDAYVWSVN